MRIGIDARFAVHARRGIGNYVLNLVRELAVVDGKNDYILYTDRQDREGVLPRQANFRTEVLAPASYPLWEQFALPRRAARDAVDLLHCTGNTAPLAVSCRIALVSTIHDVMYLKGRHELPESASLYQRAGRIYRKAVVPLSAARLAGVIAVSEFSRRDTLAHLPVLAGRIAVIHEAASAAFGPVDDHPSLERLKKGLGIGGGYLLTLGAIDPRKNTEPLLRRFMELKAERKIEEKLLVVGLPRWKESRFHRLVRDSAHGGDIVFAGFVSVEELVLLYNGAAAFVYPSAYEGFGIPLLEAMACRTPVIASSVTSIPEIAGGAALLVDPADGEALKAAMVRLLGETGLREELVARGERRAAHFSWTRAARETLALYEGVKRGCFGDA